MSGSEIGSQSSRDGGVPSAPGSLPASNRSLDLRTVGEILLLTGLYVLGGKFGLSLAFVNASASAVWPPTGLALAALLLRGNRLWPAIFLGAFVVNISTQGSVLMSLAIAAGNTCEAMFGAWLVRRFAHGLRAFDRVHTISYFVVGAALLSTAVSATIGVSSLLCAGFLPREYFTPVWLTWWLGDCVSDI